MMTAATQSATITPMHTAAATDTFALSLKPLSMCLWRGLPCAAVSRVLAAGVALLLLCSAGAAEQVGRPKKQVWPEGHSSDPPAVHLTQLA